MPPKKNPLKLNELQLKTLTIMQAYADLPNGREDGGEGEITITMPALHGDHFHVGDAVVLLRDATGAVNEGVWATLARKVLIRPQMFPSVRTLAVDGLAYDTGVDDRIVHRSPH